MWKPTSSFKELQGSWSRIGMILILGSPSCPKITPTLLGFLTSCLFPPSVAIQTTKKSESTWKKWGTKTLEPLKLIKICAAPMYWSNISWDKPRPISFKEVEKVAGSNAEWSGVKLVQKLMKFRYLGISKKKQLPTCSPLCNSFCTRKPPVATGERPLISINLLWKFGNLRYPSRNSRPY